MTDSVYIPHSLKQKQWKTSVGWSIAGFICGYVVLNTLFIAVYFLALYGLMQCGMSNRQDLLYAALILTVAALLGSIGAYIYWLDNKRKNGLSSVRSGIISFFNCFFGGAIFGPYWNSRLTKNKELMKSYFLLALLIVLAAILFGYGISSFYEQSQEQQNEETETSNILNTYLGHEYQTKNYKICFESLTLVDDHYYVTSNGEKWNTEPLSLGDIKNRTLLYRNRTEAATQGKCLLLTMRITNLTDKKINYAVIGCADFGLIGRPENVCAIYFYRNANKLKDPVSPTCWFEGYGFASNYSASLSSEETRRVYVCIPWSHKEKGTKLAKKAAITCQDTADNVTFKITFNRKDLPHKKCLVLQGLY